MPLSSVVGAQSIVKPGVCTSSTRPASPFDGQVIYETDTDRAMVYNGSAWVVLSTGRANSLGLDLIKTQTIGTAVSSATVSDVFSSAYDNYQIIVDGGTGSNTSFNLQLGSTTSGYYYASHYSQYTTTAPLALSSTTGTSFVEAGRCSTTGNNMNCYLYGPFLSKKTGFRSQSTDYDTAGFLVTTAGFLNDTNSYTSFVVKPSGATMTGGTISVYGYAK